MRSPWCGRVLAGGPRARRSVHLRTRSGEVLSDERTELPQPGRRVLLQIGDTRVAFVQPDDTEAGALGAYLGKVQNGIYALVWQVADEARARAHFDKLSLRQTGEGCVSPGFAIDPEDFLGARHEFVS